MRRNLSLFTTALALSAALTIGASGQHDWEYAVTAPAQTIQKTLSLGSTPFVQVDNITGPVDVVGDGGSEVRMTAVETIRAQSQGLIAEAQKEVQLQVTQTGDSASFYVDGPFRCHGEDCHWHNPGYQVTFAFELHVPSGARLGLKTVNGGHVNVSRVNGDFQVHNVNGTITLADMGGAGDATTVNGAVKVAFSANPQHPCTFSTVNGEVSTWFKPSLAADVKYSTVNGSVYSDFDVNTSNPPAASISENGFRVFRRGGRSGEGSIGSGGAEITMHTVNGSIYLHSTARSTLSLQ